MTLSRFKHPGGGAARGDAHHFADFPEASAPSPSARSRTVSSAASGTIRRKLVARRVDGMRAGEWCGLGFGRLRPRQLKLIRREAEDGWAATPLSALGLVACLVVMYTTALLVLA